MYMPCGLRIHMKPVQYMKGENFTENRGKPRHKLVGGLGSHKPIVRVVGRQEDVRGPTN